MVESVFSKIIKREYNADILYEDEKCIVIFDIAPIRIGHCLVIPKKQVDNFVDLELEDYNYLLGLSKNLSKKLIEILHVERVVLLIEGFGVPHVHIHLIPTNNPLGLSNSNPPLNYKEFMEEKGKEIIDKLNLFENK